MNTEIELDLAKMAFEGMSEAGSGFVPMARIETEDKYGLVLLPLEGIEKWQALANLCQDFGAIGCVFMADSWTTDYNTVTKEAVRGEALAVTLFSKEGWEHHVLPYTRQGGSIVWGKEVPQGDVISEGAMLVMAALS